eukprot:scaffold80721_cov33-Tisochrysis_lutea.AAC.5
MAAEERAELERAMEGMMVAERAEDGGGDGEGREGVGDNGGGRGEERGGDNGGGGEEERVEVTMGLRRRGRRRRGRRSKGRWRMEE